ncbi:hypothetical protein [Jeotgalibacillus haloalkalitolerans]|uniref:Uncharacterized protein n=1 Tax=Jeotgalibacillus haloalkalitolerans TaxID=3104292 RepID=A0ABU5KQ73_9BACL|nr:hypothetical protein [Jeotgalibacillus sp. HH7-29]MDZ5713233.1 hypothetical protein [Jeotgalibacillus sp. HH7-29]
MLVFYREVVKELRSELIELTGWMKVICIKVKEIGTAVRLLKELMSILKESFQD